MYNEKIQMSKIYIVTYNNILYYELIYNIYFFFRKKKIDIICLFVLFVYLLKIILT